MRIISTFLPAAADDLAQGAQAILMAFDTLVDDKNLVVGITVGSIEGPGLESVRVSPIGQSVINRCASHHRRNYPHGTVVVAGIANVAGAKERVRNVLAKAPPQALVLLLAANDKVYDAAFDALGLDVQSAKQNPH